MFAKVKCCGLCCAEAVEPRSILCTKYERINLEFEILHVTFDVINDGVYANLHKGVLENLYSNLFE